MSYLHVPRIYFGGLFYTNPGTINNIARTYDTELALTNDRDQYKGVAGWNPLGTARFYLQNCTVLGGVDLDGKPVPLDPTDPLIGARVSTPSPATPKAPDGVSYSIPKLVDLDPDMQIRSEVYGMRVWVELPVGGTAVGGTAGSGAGFWGTMSVPQLRNMGGRISISGVQSSWTAVGTMAGMITDVQWLGDASVSKLLGQFKTACAEGISYRLTIDLHQNDPSTQFTSGDQFFYGRVHGCFGPAYPQAELAQVVPGRMLQVPASPPAPAEIQEPPSATREATLEAIAGRIAVLGTKAPSVSLNASPALLRTATDGSGSLTVDYGGASWLAVGDDNQVLGKYLVDQGIELGYIAGTGFTKFAAPAVSFADQYDDRLIGNSQKSCYLVRNSGIVDIPLTAAEVQAISNAPLALQVDGQQPLQESAGGWWIELSEASRRLQPNEQTAIRMMMRKFGAPVTGTPPALSIQVQASDWTGDTPETFRQPNPLPNSDAVSITLAPELDANGLVDVTVAASNPDPLGTLRTFMDSKVFFVTILDPDGQPIGDQPVEGYALSVLLWAAYDIPAQPTWDRDVGPILQSYTRLYPGMKSIMDIGDQATVLGSAAGIRARMSLSASDPGAADYMPVTRDLSPNKVQTVVNWLTQQIQTAKA